MTYHQLKRSIDTITTFGCPRLGGAMLYIFTSRVRLLISNERRGQRRAGVRRAKSILLIDVV